jgi:hypothetical protein
MMRDERPVKSVPAAVWGLLAFGLAVQVLWQGVVKDTGRFAEELPPAPRREALRIASFGEPEAAARVGMVYLQSFDLGGTNAHPYRNLDYSRLVGWLSAILALDPRSDYPLFAASRVYAEVPDPARMRIMLEFVHKAFLRDPDRRWASLAHAALLAKHRLRDLQLARRYAADLQRFITDASVPLWATQMEVFILEDMNELEAARIMLGGLLASGKVTDSGEAVFLKRRLEELEEKAGTAKVK